MTSEISADGPHQEAKIGPNAIAQVAAALCAAATETTARRVFRAADLSHWFDEPPTEMVPESSVTALHKQVREQLPPDQAQKILFDAGVRTGYYVLKRRIPGFARAILRALPPIFAGPLLLRAIERNAWTFVGSGRFVVTRNDKCLLEIYNNPVIAGERSNNPICHWHAAVFETLFKELVWSGTTVTEKNCCASGYEACTFELVYR
ncbi:bacteriochlorophyll 4-vinyl reductase [Halorhodospira halochloris]|uniref:bacteriochlorophyll 4-vinyl reductase n=1 Tax=Halorhodospira halochloris TaxID=1052 RepID=UPI001EE8E787|nr:bacteriochlorophyll 4-vinyl reductase [Halorhodospira halochloris]MCG5530215.1 bacteriochlorophyll 4-vinyl reductase [Halorhodospira halochloris]